LLPSPDFRKALEQSWKQLHRKHGSFVVSANEADR
jgi:hypothetical protein